MAIKPVLEPRLCQACHKEEINPVSLRACSACKTVFYCNPTCQKSHWKEHKPNCLQNRVTDRTGIGPIASKAAKVAAESVIMQQLTADGTIKNVSSEADFTPGRPIIIDLMDELQRISRIPRQDLDRFRKEIYAEGHEFESQKGLDLLWVKIVKYRADNKKGSYPDVIRILKGSMACPKNLQGFISELQYCRKSLEELKNGFNRAPARYLEELRALAEGRTSDLTPLLARLDSLYARKLPDGCLGRRELDAAQINRLDPNYNMGFHLKGPLLGAFSDIKKVFQKHPNRLEVISRIENSQEQYVCCRRPFAKAQDLGIPTKELCRAFEAAHGDRLPQGSEVITVSYSLEGIPLSSYIMVLPRSVSASVPDDATDIYVQTPSRENHQVIMERLSSLVATVSRLNRGQFKDEETFLQNVEELSCRICFLYTHAGLYKGEIESIFTMQYIQQLIFALHGYTFTPLTDLYYMGRWAGVVDFNQGYHANLGLRLIKNDENAKSKP
ncbi:MAG: zinc finger MYND domain-containing protein [Chlamydiia bacterium]|nr:zinc finger MYND domain-containing protein [Chlamydiia bacterium]